MTLARWYQRSALALIMLAIFAYSVASGSPEFGVLAGPVVFALWKLSSRRGGTASSQVSGGAGGGRFLLPRLVVNIMLFAVLAYALLRAQGTLEVETIAQVVVLIQIIKIGDRRAPRDDAQILCLAVFLVIAAMLDSNSVWTGVLLLVFLPLMITTVMLFQLHQGAVRAGGANTPDLPSDLCRRSIRATSAIATVGTVILGLVVFVLMPRGIGENAFGNWGAARRGATTGFSSSVTLGSQGVLSTSPTVVFNLIIKDSTGQNIGSPDSVQYMRGAVLNDYTASKWTLNSPDKPDTGDVNAPEIPTTVSQRRGLEFEQIISPRASFSKERRRHLFALWAPVRFQINSTVTYFSYRDEGVLQVKADIPSPEYHVWSVPFETHNAEAPAITRRPIPEVSDRIRDLAVNIVTAAGAEPDPALRPIEDDAAVARAIQVHLQNAYTYTLEMEAPPKDVDPVEHFLFNRKKGHCEYFASAMVLLCRGVGINARMVTGYLATEFSTATGTYTVRESNAHAWVEARDEAGRWRRFDPTPPADLQRIHRASPGLFGRIRQALEAMEYAWNSSIVAFNEQTRQSLLGPSRGENAGMLGRIEQVSQRLRAGGPRLLAHAATRGAAVFLLVASLGIALQLALRMVHRRRQGSRATTASDVRGDGAYRGMLKLLARRKLGKPPWLPPLEHADTLAAASPVLAQDVRLVSEAYYRKRFRGTKDSTEETRVVREALSRIRRFRSQAPRGS